MQSKWMEYMGKYENEEELDDSSIKHQRVELKQSKNKFLKFFKL